MKNTSTVSRTIRFKASISREINERAAKENRTFSNMVETLLLKCFEYEKTLKNDYNNQKTHI